ncbi:MAG: helix-turn-helix domain-containing protein [Spirochaetia bacterium]|nr:helix-turn-helix domain-containing protein [Spirochaetia bacterium]
MIQVTGLLGLDFPIASLLAISVLFVVRTFLDSHFKWKRIYWLFYSYPLLQFCFYLLDLYLNFNEKQTALQILYDSEETVYLLNPVSYYLHFIVMVAVYIYLYFLIRNKMLWRNALQKYQKKLVLGIWFLYFLIFITFIIYFRIMLSAKLHFNISEFEHAFLYFSAFILYVFLQVFPFIFKYGITYFDSKTFSIERALNRYFEGRDISEIERKLDHLMKDDKIFKDDTLTSSELAGYLGLTVHQLSNYLNQYMGKSFFEFMNDVRVAEAKSILQNDPDFKIIDLSYAVGYSTPSVFYRAFKKIEGLSPKDWMKKNRR